MTERFRHFLRYQSPALLWAGVIFIASSIPAPRLPHFAHLVNDKIVHSLVYFVFGVLVFRAFEPVRMSARFQWKQAALSILIVVCYGLLDEFHQSFVPGRSVDILDASADALGGILAAAAMYARFRRKQLLQKPLP